MWSDYQQYVPDRLSKKIPVSVIKDALNIGMFLLTENFFTKNEK